MSSHELIIERPDYLDWLSRWREQQIIKVVSGVRRSGKSTLFELYRARLLDRGVRAEQIHAYNFEEVEFEDLAEHRKLYDHITARLVKNKVNYIFLDEVQHVERFEKAVDSLFLKKNCDVYITGSNAYFMSGELATLLSGRYVELKMLPLSFAEYCAGVQALGHAPARAALFDQYLTLGSFPYVLRFGRGRREAAEYLRDLYSTVLLKDIVARLRILDVNTFENVAKFMLHNIGSPVSPTKIANTLKSAGKGVDQKTVDRYLRGLTDSLILYEAPRFNIKGRQFLTSNSKYYAVDAALRNALVRGAESDAGHLLENIVYLELLRRGNRVFAGVMEGGGEVDFVAEKDGALAYYQVSTTVLDERVLKRELQPLRKIADNHPKFLLTLDEVFGSANYDGIIKRNVLEWLLNRG